MPQNDDNDKLFSGRVDGGGAVVTQVARDARPYRVLKPPLGTT